MEAGEAAAVGIHRVDPEIRVTVRPLADGGEGTVEALAAGMNGVLKPVTVTGPAGRPVDCVYTYIPDRETAVIEMAGASGITLVSGEEKNPLHTTTYGLGEVIRAAVKEGCRKFIIGIGGSATNDGGVGMLQALGFGCLDEEGKDVPFGALGLRSLAKITEEGVLPELRECSFRVACDVTNPLCGEKGASAVYGPQKGATPEMVRDMDEWMKGYAVLAGKTPPEADGDCPGAGAAGGLGFAFLTFLNGKLESGIRIILDETRLEEYIREADLVITGEGQLDFQTAMGKAPIGVAGLAAKYGKPVIAFAGSVTKDAGECNEKGIAAFFPVLRRISTLEEAMEPGQAKDNMADTAEQVFRLLTI